MFKENSKADRRVMPRYLIPELVARVGNIKARIGNLSSRGAILYFENKFQNGAVITLEIRRDLEIEYGLEAKIIRAEPSFVAIEFLKPLQDHFWQKYFNPSELASRMVQIDEGWWHAPNADIHLRKFRDGAFEQIQVIIGPHYIEWRDLSGVSTGEIDSTRPVRGNEQLSEISINYDFTTNNDRVELAQSLLEAVHDIDPLAVVHLSR